MQDWQHLASTAEERDFISAALDTAGALVVVLDRQGRIVRFNRACERTTGYSFNEVKGKLLWESFLVPEEVEPVKAVFEELRAGQFPNEYENYWLTKDGRRRLIAWSNTALLGAEGAVEYVIGTGIDVADRKQAEEALRMAHDELRVRVLERTGELEQANESLLFNACHHWMNPVLADLGNGVAAMLAGESHTPLPFFHVVPWALRGQVLLPFLQILGAAATLRRLRRWRLDPEHRPSGGRARGFHILLPLIPNLLVALTLKSVLGKRRGYLRLYMSDSAWIAMVSGGFALLWSFLRTGLVLGALRRR
jgi:PAS domain S-box-containing protein